MSDKIDKINKLEGSLYSERNYSELQALQKLFSSQFLYGLEKILNENSRKEHHFKEVYNVSLGWIDKMPLASFVRQTKDINGHIINPKKVELGDFLLIYNHSQQHNSCGKIVTQTLDNRALIVQAKKSIQRQPIVPIQTMSTKKVSSTSKELALLSNWPEFDLFKSSRSNSPLLKNIRLNPSNSNSQYSGFYKKYWDYGDPRFGAKCSLTTGEIFSKMINKQTGQVFEYGGKKDWDKLITTLLELCGKFDAPGYLFGKKSKRLKTLSWFFERNNLNFFFFGPDISSILRLDRKLPVLTINRLFEEGDLAKA